MLSDLLARIAREYQYEASKPFSGNELADLIRTDLRKEATKTISFRQEEYLIKGSPGQSTWASVPWLGFFDPLVTTSAQREFYVVFLINPREESVYLSLNQGTTAVDREYGKTAARSVLRNRAQEMRMRLTDHLNGFSTDNINLSSTADLPTGYEAGHALGKRYSADQMIEPTVSNDLNRILDLYQILIQRGGLLSGETILNEADSDDIEESRKYVYSQRIERAPYVRKKVLKAKPHICEGCGLDPKLDYGYKGDPFKVPLDVHHLTPIHTLNEGETRKYRIPQDFAVLCPTCHRVAHKLENPSDITALKRKIRFKLLRELF